MGKLAASRVQWHTVCDVLQNLSSDALASLGMIAERRSFGLYCIGKQGLVECIASWFVSCV